MTEKLATIDISTLTGDKVESLLNNPKVAELLCFAVFLKLYELQSIRTAVRDIAADDYMLLSNSIPDKHDPHRWKLTLPLDQLKLLR